MITRTVHAQLLPRDEIQFNSRYPKIVFSNGKHIAVINSTELAAVQSGPTELVLEPFATPSVTVDSVEYPLVLGRDYSRCVLVSKTKSYVINRRLPAPSLDVLYSGGTIELNWGSAFDAPTRLYRTDTFVAGGMLPTRFNLIAEVDGPAIPEASVYYVDISISLAPGRSVAYYIENINGRSSTKVATN